MMRIVTAGAPFDRACYHPGAFTPAASHAVDLARSRDPAAPHVMLQFVGRVLVSIVRKYIA